MRIFDKVLEGLNTKENEEEVVLSFLPAAALWPFPRSSHSTGMNGSRVMFARPHFEQSHAEPRLARRAEERRGEEWRGEAATLPGRQGCVATICRCRNEEGGSDKIRDDDDDDEEVSVVF